MRRFRCAVLPTPATEVVLDAQTSGHLGRVLRARPGDVVVLFDGAGREVDARVVEVGERVTVVGVGVPREVAPHVPCTLVLAVLKGPAMDTAVRMGTEAGATRILPVRAARSVATGDRSDRWRRIATSAAQQCGRADVPEVAAPVSLDQALEALGAVEVRIAVPGADARPPATGPVAVLVGPEGGWTDPEVAQVLAAGGVAVGVARWVLRADTAAAVAVARTLPVTR